MDKPVAKILKELKNTELWDINFSKLVRIITQSLSARNYAVFTKNMNRYHLVLSEGYSKTITVKDLIKSSAVSLKFRMEDRDFRLFIEPHRKTKMTRHNIDLIQCTADLISKTLSMRQISKSRILETQIINELNLNVITTLSERKIISTLEKAARKMLHHEKIWLFYLIDDSLIGSQSEFKIRNIPEKIYFQLFRGQQIFTSSKRIKVISQLFDNSEPIRNITFIPFSIKNQFRGFFIVGEDILNKRKNYDITRLRFLANQAALAIERIDLFQALNRALRESHGLQELIKIMLSTLDIETLFNEILQRAQKLLGFNRILFSMYDPVSRSFDRVTGVGIPPPVLEKAKAIHPPFEMINGLFQHRYRISNSFYIPADVHDDNVRRLRRYQLFKTRETKKPYNEIWDAGDIFISPIYSKDRELVGILSLDQPSTNLVPSQEKVRLLEALGDFLGMAIANAQIFSKIENLSNTDELTGVFNYRFLREKVAALIKDGTKTMTLIMIDLDNFKLFNDQYGHLKGDQILRLFSQLLVGIVGKAGHIIRYGGDEFIILLSGKSRIIARKIITKVKTRITQSKQEISNLQFSYGIALYPNDGNELGSLIDYADRLVYKSKLSKRNGIKT